jgi:hypothetical protein
MRYLLSCLLPLALVMGCATDVSEPGIDEVEDELGGGSSSTMAAIGGIYQLQAAFHEAKTAADIDLMMSLWARNSTFTNQNDANSPYDTETEIRNFWLNSGSFLNRRFSLVPSFKTQIVVQSWDTAYLYFECHDVGDYDLSSRFIAGDTFLAGTVVKRNGRWQFKNMTAGRAFPLSADQYFFTP